MNSLWSQLCWAYATGFPPSCSVPGWWGWKLERTLSCLNPSNQCWEKMLPQTQEHLQWKKQQQHLPLSVCLCVSQWHILKKKKKEEVIDSFGQEVPCNLDTGCHRVTGRYIKCLCAAAYYYLPLHSYWNQLNFTQRSYLSFLWFHRERWRVLVSFCDSSVHVSCFSIRQEIILK